MAEALAQAPTKERELLAVMAGVSARELAGSASAAAGPAPRSRTQAPDGFTPVPPPEAFPRGQPRPGD